MSDPLEAFASTLDLDASRAFNSPALIFLCGGRINGPPGADPSLRALFYDRLKKEHPSLSTRVLLAEEANKWSSVVDGQYRNLLDLESDLACLSAVILLFVESAGSIAELGVFSQTEVLRDKLVPVLEYSHQEDESFIRYGPVALLDQRKNKSVFFLPWLGTPDKDGKRSLDNIQAQQTVSYVLDWLSKHMAELSNEEKFRRQDHGHRQLLIADLISLGTIVRRNEIESFLRGLECNIPTQELNQYLFLLDKLNIIERSQYGHPTYFLASSEGAEYVRYAFKLPRKAADRQRIKSDLIDALPKDADRRNALDAFRKKSNR